MNVKLENEIHSIEDWRRLRLEAIITQLLYGVIAAQAEHRVLHVDEDELLQRVNSRALRINDELLSVERQLSDLEHRVLLRVQDAINECSTSAGTDDDA